jgi:formate-dependent nitrite reductase membrane component NrfD
MTEIDVIRTNPGVDPALHIWGWEIPVYLFLGGVTAGVMVLTALLGRGRGEARSRALRLLPFAAPLLISVGMLALFLDLAHKLHVYRFYLILRPSSPMSWGAWILVAIYPVTILQGLAGLTRAEEDAVTVRLPRLLGRLVERLRGFAVPRRAGLETAAVLLGVLLGVYTGVLLGSLAARAAWSSALLGPLFLVSGVSTGAAFLLLFPLAAEERHQLGRWDAVLIAAELGLLALFLVGHLTGGAARAAAAALFLGGRFTAPFFALVVAAGLLVPLVLAGVEASRRLRPTLVAPVLVLVGGLSLRWILVLAGQA